MRAVVKFELLADLDDSPAGATVRFDGCDDLGAANLRGTRFAARDRVARELAPADADHPHPAQVYVTGLSGFLLAKAAAAHSRRKPKDWYDLAFVLLHNDEGGPTQAADLVKTVFADDLTGDVATALSDMAANFAVPDAQGPEAYAGQLLLDHPDLDPAEVAADAVTAVHLFCRTLGIGT